MFVRRSLARELEETQLALDSLGETAGAAARSAIRKTSTRKTLRSSFPGEG